MVRPSQAERARISPTHTHYSNPVAGLGSRVYRKSWTDKDYAAKDHNFLITRPPNVSTG